MLEKLEERLDYQFTDKALLARALTHRSLAGVENNERLEFLGDAVLSHIIAEALFQRHPQAAEGELSRMRSVLVRGDRLAEMARSLELGNYLKLGVGEKKSGGRGRCSILADAFEALVGALYLDAGIGMCREVVLSIYGEEIDTLLQATSMKDAKSTLQEWLQAHKLPLPTYEVTVSGEAHAQTFDVVCRVEGLRYEARGTSTSRRRAEQAARSGGRSAGPGMGPGRVGRERGRDR